MHMIRKKISFSAAHRLHSPKFSDEENRRIYGKCNNPYGHGHNYDLEVCVIGEPHPDTGMVINFTDLKNIVRQEVYDLVDHRNLNVDVEFMQGVIPTAENIAQKVWERIEPDILKHGARLYSVTVSEKDTNVAVYFGPTSKLLEHFLLGEGAYAEVSEEGR